MLRFFSIGVVLLALAGTATSAQAQNQQPVTPVRRNPTERISPMPGVQLPAGVGQRRARPVPVPTQVLPADTLASPAVPHGKVTAGPVDSVQVTPTARPTKKRP